MTTDAEDDRTVGLFGDEPKNEAEQLTLLGDAEWWKDDWRGMPEFVQQDLSPWKTVYVHFESADDLRKFAETVGQTITERTRSIWFPQAEIGRFANKAWVDASFRSRATKGKEPPTK